MTLRRFAATVAFSTVLTLVLGLVSPALAQPTPEPPDEAGPPTLQQLRDNVQAAASGFMEAEGKLEASKNRQAELQHQLTIAELDMARVRVSIGRYAGEAYRQGRLNAVALMLQATSQENLIGRAVALNKMSQYDQARLAEFLAAKQRAADAKALIDKEVAEQAAQADEMKRRQQAAEKALAQAGGTRTRVDIDHSTLPTAKPAPRNPDGSWPSQSATVDDPTTGGNITPRLHHAYSETKRFGWDWYVSCWRSGTQYEHPKGRACDWATHPDTFKGTAVGDAKTYGDRLASFYVKNAKALGVMYVVWYCTIWVYGSGWRKYNSSGSRCGDSPAVDHTNHVHLSVY